MTARSKSCSVPLTISDALADCPSMRTTRGMSGAVGRPNATYDLFHFSSLPRVETISVPFGTNRLTMATLSLSNPPPLPRRSSTNCSMPAESRRAMRALRTSPAEPRVNLDR